MMDAQVRSCSLLIAGERYGGFDYVVEASLGLETFGFVSGPAKPLNSLKGRHPLNCNFQVNRRERLQSPRSAMLASRAWCWSLSGKDPRDFALPAPLLRVECG